MCKGDDHSTKFACYLQNLHQGSEVPLASQNDTLPLLKTTSPACPSSCESGSSNTSSYILHAS